MLSGNALRHQMVLPLQQSLYDYWRSKCGQGRLPSRRDIDPMHIKTHLPMVSITEVKKETTRKRFQMRLVGTGFWDLYEDEIQGRFVDELPIGDRRRYWQRVLTQVTDSGRPTAGVTRTGTPYGSHFSQFWIRLPLSENGSDVNMILGYDHLVKASDMPKLVQPAVRQTA